AVLVLGNHAFEVAVFERMVLGLHREAALARIEARSLGHRPALQDAVQLEAKVIVQPPRRMALHRVAERLSLSRATAALRLGRNAEVAHLAVAPEAVAHARSQQSARRGR